MVTGCKYTYSCQSEGPVVEGSEDSKIFSAKNLFLTIKWCHIQSYQNRRIKPNVQQQTRQRRVPLISDVLGK